MTLFAYSTEHFPPRRCWLMARPKSPAPLRPCLTSDSFGTAAGYTGEVASRRKPSPWWATQARNISETPDEFTYVAGVTCKWIVDSGDACACEVRFSSSSPQLLLGSIAAPQRPLRVFWALFHWISSHHACGRQVQWQVDAGGVCINGQMCQLNGWLYG